MEARNANVTTAAGALLPGAGHETNHDGANVGAVVKRESKLNGKKEGESMTTNTRKNRRKYEQMFRCGQNKKVGVDTVVFNFGAAMDCPSLKLGLCQVAVYDGVDDDGNPVVVSCDCYAMTKERYSTVVSGRRRQAIYWVRTPAHVIALDAVREMDRTHTDRYTHETRSGAEYIRISESGDVYDQSDISKLTTVAKWVYAMRPDVKIYGYTARRDLDWAQVPPNVVMNFSGDDVSDAVADVNSFVVVPVGKLPSKALTCKSNCRVCRLCKTHHGSQVFIEEH